MAVYTGKLPAMHLAGDELIEFEEVLKTDTTNPSISIKLERNKFQYKLESLQEIIDDINKPDITKSYRITLECKEGEVKIRTADYFGGRVQISGDDDWVRKKKRQLYAFLNKNKKIIRTYLNKIAYGFFFIQLAIFWIINLATSGGNGEHELIMASFAFFALIFITFWPLIFLEIARRTYPKHILKKDDSIRFRPLIHRMISTTISILMLIGGIGGLVTVFLTVL